MLRARTCRSAREKPARLHQPLIHVIERPCRRVAIFRATGRKSVGRTLHQHELLVTRRKMVEDDLAGHHQVVTGHRHHERRHRDAFGVCWSAARCRRPVDADDVVFREREILLSADRRDERNRRTVVFCAIAASAPNSLAAAPPGGRTE